MNQNNITTLEQYDKAIDQYITECSNATRRSAILLDNNYSTQAIPFQDGTENAAIFETNAPVIK